MSEPRQGPELVAWGQGQWVTPSPPPMAEHISSVPVSRPAWPWGGPRGGAGEAAWLWAVSAAGWGAPAGFTPLPLSLKLGFQGPWPFGSWAVLAWRHVVLMGAESSTWDSPSVPRAPSSHCPALGSGASKVGCACIPASWRKAFHPRQALPAPSALPCLSCSR